MNYSGEVRRIDLNLRAKYPWIETIIYKIDDYNYEIHPKGFTGNFESLKKDFDHSIKFITTPVILSPNEPKIFVDILPPIDDSAIPCKFEGLPLTLFELANLIESRNYGITVNKIEQTQKDRSLIIHLSDTIDDKLIPILNKQLEDLKLSLPFHIVKSVELSQIKKPDNDVFFIPSSYSVQSRQLPFLKRDESLWFDNIDAIYRGDFKKDNLFFFEPETTSCYIDFTSFQNINVRNHLLLYDVLFISLPLHERMHDFLVDQKMTKEDLLYLITSGRIKIVNIQPEWRLDLDFLKAVSNANIDSIISRRGIATLCAIDTVQTFKRYAFSDPELSKLVKPLADAISTIYSIPQEKVTAFLLWPQMALRTSFNALQFAGTKGIAQFGVNQLITEMLGRLNNEKQKAIEFEFTVNSEAIHIANALESTYFPFITEGKYTDYPFTLQMGNLLSFFQLYNENGISENQQEALEFEKRNPTLDLISIFQVNEYISWEEFEKSVSSQIYRRELHSLFSEINILSPGEQNELISKYNKLVEETLKSKTRINFALDLTEDAIGLGVPFVSTGKKAVKKVYKYAENKFPVFKDLDELVRERTLKRDPEKRRISILARLNKVARLNMIK